MPIDSKLVKRFLMLGVHATWIALIPTVLFGFEQMYFVPGVAIIVCLAFACGVSSAIASWLIDKQIFRGLTLPGLIVAIVSASPVFFICFWIGHAFPWFTIPQDVIVIPVMGFAIFHGTARPFRD